jgi:hypothetical protein
MVGRAWRGDFLLGDGRWVISFWPRFRTSEERLPEKNVAPNCDLTFFLVVEEEEMHSPRTEKLKQ